MDSVYLAVHRATKRRGVERAARAYLVRFDALEPQAGPKAAYKTVVLAFPRVSLSRAPKVIDAVQLKLKPEFVARGLMIGKWLRIAGLG